MKTKTLLTLLAGVMASSMVMASTTTTDYTLETSGNLVDQYQFSDSGYYASTGSDWLGSTPTYITTASVLGTYQSGEQWYQTTQFVTTETNSTRYQDFTVNLRNLNFYVTDGAVANAFVDLSFNVGSTTSYYVYAGGLTGVTTSPRGFSITQTPTLGMRVDSANVIPQSWSNQNSDGMSDWYSYSSGSVDSSFQAAVEAPGSSALRYLNVNLSRDRVYGAEYTQTSSYVSSTWTQDVAISAPVPEPETYAMMLAGLGLMGAVARRRRAKAA